MVNNVSVKYVPFHKQIHPILDAKLEFNENFDSVLTKVNNKKILLEKFQNFLPQNSLLTLYKNFVRPHLDFDDVFYDKVGNKIFHKKS